MPALFVEEEVLGGEGDGVGALLDLPADVFEDVVERHALAIAQRHRTELAAAAATARDLDDTKGRAVEPVGNAVERRAVSLDAAWDGLAPDGAFE